MPQKPDEQKALTRPKVCCLARGGGGAAPYTVVTGDKGSSCQLSTYVSAPSVKSSSTMALGSLMVVCAPDATTVAAAASDAG